MSLAKTIADTLHPKERAKKNGNGWLTCCPVHGDKKPSLSIMDTRNKNVEPDVVMHCHAGWSTCTSAKGEGDMKKRFYVWVLKMIKRDYEMTDRKNASQITDCCIELIGKSN